MLRVTFLFSCLFFITKLVCAQQGVLDNTFGSGGIVTTAVGNGYATGQSSTLQSDGKILVAGSFSYDDMKFEFLLVRYNANGSIDTTFGNHGIDTLAIDSFDDLASSVAIEPNGKIVVAGSSFDSLQNRFALVRYNQNGKIDTTFGDSGIIITAFGNTSNNGNAMVVQPDGKIIVAGSASNDSITEFALARYDSTGVIDTTFGDSGEVITAIGVSDDEAYAVALQSNNEILAAGESYNGNDYDFALVRYFADGALDTLFGTKGKVTTDFSGYDDLAYSMAVQTNGNIVLAGATFNGITSAYQIGLARYTTTGILDNTFANAGLDTTSIGGFDDEAQSVTIQTDGKIVIGGYADISSNDEFAVVRYNTDGSLDTTSNGGNGKVTTPVDSVSTGESIFIQPDDKIVLAGYSQSQSSLYNTVAVVRYLTTLTLGIADIEQPGNMVFVYPNPIKNEAVLDYTLGNDETISLSIYDLNGQLMQTIFTNETITKGEHRQLLNLENLSSGLYLVALTNSSSQSVYIKIIKQ